MIDGQLAVGTRAPRYDRAGMFELRQAAESGSVFPQQVDQLLDQLTHRPEAAGGEVGELGLHAPALRPPFVLLDQDASIDPPALIAHTQPPKMTQEALVDGGDRQRVL